MSIRIQRMPDGRIQVTVAGTALSSEVQQIIRPALTRHLIELSAAIENAAPHAMMEEKRDEAIQGRRHTFRLMEQFDLAIPEVNSVARWLGVIYTELDRDDIKLLRGAVQWYSDHWVEEGKKTEFTLALLTLLNKC